MSASTIEWTDYTWNPWWGCEKIAPECDHCYAASFASRGLHAAHAGVAKNGNWTGNITRSRENVWQAPFAWREGRVFTCSMSDFFHEDAPLEWLSEALNVIEQTPKLTYQVLTKRPGNVRRRLRKLRRQLPDNVHLGVTIGHEKSLRLLKPFKKVQASLRFLSCEPLLTPLAAELDLEGIGWVIAGGESGPKARRCKPRWVRDLRDLCQTVGVPFFLKQWGRPEFNPTPSAEELDPKAKGGATLDGRLWREFPAR
jgi:protein gp37